MRSAGSAARRYAPLGVVLAVQLLLVAVLPSTAPKTTDVAATGGAQDGTSGLDAGGTGADGGAGGSSDVAGVDGGATGADGGTGAAGSGAGSGTGTGGYAGGSAAGGSAGGGSAATTAVGDTKHCVAGRQFDPAIDYYAPTCTPKFTGTNPGATYRGVTASTIKVVDYYPKGNAAVDTSTKAQGLYVSIDQQRTWDAAAADFINSHFELYGRKVEISVVQGTCDTIPPDTTCLRDEMDEITSTQKPYAFRWVSPLTNAPFDELSAQKVVNLGGLMFTDPFNEARRPYHWDVHMSGTQIADQFGELWCKQLKGKPAQFGSAGTPNGTAGNPNGKTRVLGIIGTADPENIKMRQEVDRVLRTCGDHVYHTYDASNDLSTAPAQKSASVANMRQSPEATTVLCLCNPVGAQFVFQEMQQNGYYPENVFAGTVYSDLDDAGQSFMSGAGCPSGSRCSFTGAFGLQTQEERQPVGSDTAARVWRAAGRQGNPPFSGTQLDWEYLELLGTMLQAAGPNLTPQTMEAGTLKLPAVGGGASGHVLRRFGPGDHTWNSDTVLVYWDGKKSSPYNGKAGTYVRVGPRRTLGNHPSGDVTGIPPPAQR